MDFAALTNFVIAMGLGALIGLEREIEQQKAGTKDFGGVRTFILICLFGALAGHIGKITQNSSLFVYSLFGLTILVTVAYYRVSNARKRYGIQTEISAILTFIFGYMCLTGLVKYAIMFTVLITVFLAMKKALHGFARRVTKTEIYATLEFAVISLVILPFLPNKNYSFMDIPIISEFIQAVNGPVKFIEQINVLNPYYIWLMVVLVSAISFIGYILAKVYGAQKGIGITGLVGGIISSIAVTINFAERSKKRKVVHALSLGVLLATAITFVRLIFLVAVVNQELTVYVIFPLSLMAIAGFVCAAFLKGGKEKQNHFEFKTPVAIIPALKFGIFFTFVLFVSKTGQLLFGEMGVYVVSFFAGFANASAIVLSLANLQAEGVMSLTNAAFGITLAAIGNTCVKLIIALMFGSKKFYKIVGWMMVLIIATGIVSLLV